jgi:hypothetical protein
MNLVLDNYQASITRQAVVLLLKQSMGEMKAAKEGKSRIKGNEMAAEFTADVCREILTLIDGKST